MLAVYEVPIDIVQHLRLQAHQLLCQSGQGWVAKTKILVEACLQARGQGCVGVEAKLNERGELSELLDLLCQRSEGIIEQRRVLMFRELLGRSEGAMLARQGQRGDSRGREAIGDVHDSESHTLLGRDQLLAFGGPEQDGSLPRIGSALREILGRF